MLKDVRLPELLHAESLAIFPSDLLIKPSFLLFIFIKVTAGLRLGVGGKVEKDLFCNLHPAPSINSMKIVPEVSLCQNREIGGLEIILQQTNL